MFCVLILLPSFLVVLLLTCLRWDFKILNLNLYLNINIFPSLFRLLRLVCCSCFVMRSVTSLPHSMIWSATFIPIASFFFLVGFFVLFLRLWTSVHCSCCLNARLFHNVLAFCFLVHLLQKCLLVLAEHRLEGTEIKVCTKRWGCFLFVFCFAYLFFVLYQKKKKST